MLLVVLDTVRADHLSCCDPGRPTTPRIDRFAAGATRFDRAYATSFWTLPSHASLLTGLFPSQAGATSESNHLPAAAQTLAERLRGAGYATGAVVRNAWLSEERGFAQGFDHYVEAWRDDPEGPDLAAERRAVAGAIDWLGGRAAGPAPFFLFVNLNIAHLPYDPPAERRERFLAPGREPSRVERMMTVRGGWAHLTGADVLDEADLRVLAELYRAEVSLADELAGELLETLTALGILDRTLVVITSDHGENLGEHGMIDHVNSMYETTVRVPLVIRFPGGRGRGRVEDELVSLLDVAPTVLDLAGLEARTGATAGGAASLADPDRAPRDRVFAENSRPMNGLRRVRRLFPEFDAALIDHPLRMMRDRRHKLIWRAGRGAELYDLAADPAEALDLAASRLAHRDEMLLSLREWASGLGTPSDPRRFVSRDPESLRQLRALGYLD